MFNFTTQTIYNKVVVATDAQVKAKAIKGYNIITGTDSNKPELRIGNTRFNKEDVLDIHKASFQPENLAKTEIDIAKLISLVTTGEKDTQEGNYRIVFYIGLSMNSQDAAYSNAFVYKGKPLFIEFPIKTGDTAADVAKRIVKIANKYILFTAGEKILNVVASTDKVVFTAINGYQQFKTVLVQKYDPNAGNSYDCCSSTGDFVTYMTGVPVAYTVVDGAVATKNEVLEDGELRELENTEFAILPGLEAFLDYNWIIHNLRLPTLANTYFWSPAKQMDEMPIVGGQYNQYIIRLCKERDGIAGHVVGHRATSVTTHVFYVLDDGVQGANGSIGKFEAELKKVLPEGETDFKTDADEAYAEPYAAIGD